MTNFLPLDQHFLRLAKKPVSGGVFYFNKNNKVLLVKQNYNDYWSTPGGSTDEMESPYQAATREVSEELGVSLPVGRLLLIEYKYYGEKMDAFNFYFYGGVLTEEQISKINIQKEELGEFKFFGVEEATSLFDPKSKYKIKLILKALETKQIVYLENGREII